MAKTKNNWIVPFSYKHILKQWPCKVKRQRSVCRRRKRQEINAKVNFELSQNGYGRFIIATMLRRPQIYLFIFLWSDPKTQSTHEWDLELVSGSEFWYNLRYFSNRKRTDTTHDKGQNAEKEPPENPPNPNGFHGEWCSIPLAPTLPAPPNMYIYLLFNHIFFN